MKETWQLVEQHGVWWAYQGELPPPEAFQSHGRPPRPVLGPYASRVIAEALLGRQLAQTALPLPAHSRHAACHSFTGGKRGSMRPMA